MGESTTAATTPLALYFAECISTTDYQMNDAKVFSAQTNRARAPRLMCNDPTDQ